MRLSFVVSRKQLPDARCVNFKLSLLSYDIKTTLASRTRPARQRATQTADPPCIIVLGIRAAIIRYCILPSILYNHVVG